MTQTTPTTAECIEWLFQAKEYFSTKTSQGMAMGTDDYETIETIRAQLLAAQEMAKALELYKNGWTNGVVYEGGGLYPTDEMAADRGKKATKALTAWRNAGGE